MIRRMFCLLCAALLLCSAAPVSAETAAETPADVTCYDFDLVFSLNADAFPALSRSRVSGYADLLASLGLRGTVAWSTLTKSFEMEATLYFISDPSLSYPFRVCGTEEYLFVTTPLLPDDELFLGLAALLEFSMKAKNTLNLPLPQLAILYPFSTTYPLANVITAWQEVIGSFTESGEISVAQFEELSERWNAELTNNDRIQRWIMAVMDISEAPNAVENEFICLPQYYEIVTGGEPVTVTVSEGSEVWRNASGMTLYSRQESESASSMAISLPATENGYASNLSAISRTDGTFSSFDLTATIAQAGPDLSAGGDAYTDSEAGSDEAGYPYTDDEAYADEDGYPYTDSDSYTDEDGYPYTDSDDYTDEDSYPYTDDESYMDEDGYPYTDSETYSDEDAYPYTDDEAIDEVYDEAIEEGASASADDDDEDGLTGSRGTPDLMLYLSLAGEGLPRSLPADSDFTVTASILGALYPDYSFRLLGTTKKDGTVSLSLCKPGDSETEPVRIFSVSGTMTPASWGPIPDYMKKNLDNVINVFSFNEVSLAEFRNRAVPLLLRSALTFVSAAPTSACQSFLDDLTESGVLGLLFQ